MKQRISRIALIGVMLAGSQVFAIDLTNQSSFSKKQLSGCMSKLMLANRTLSYNDAKKTCSDQLKSQNASDVSAAARRVDLTAASGPGLAH